MNRRAFFGFACGGVAAAPAALIGTHKPAKAEIAALEIKIDVSEAGDLKAYVEDVARRELENHVWSHPWRDERPYRAART